MRKTMGMLILLGAWTLLIPACVDAAADDPWVAARFTRSVEEPEAPDFTLLNMEGRKVRLKEYRGKVVMLFFWAGW